MPGPSLYTDQLREDLGRAGSTRPPGLLDASPHLVTSLASVTVGGADGVSITLERHGRMTTAALSSRDVIAMAQGVLMSRSGVSAEVAAATLYRAARDKETAVHAEPAAVLDSTRADHGGAGESRG